MILRAAQLFASTLLIVSGAAMDTPQNVATRVAAAFAESAPSDFAGIMPVQEARELVLFAAEKKLSRHRGLARVLAENSNTALLLISGHVGGIPNSGDETIFSASFSGIYEAARDTEGVWRIARRVPIDTTGRIVSHDLAVTVEPGAGMLVHDTIRVSIEQPWGLIVRLNHRAQIAET